MTTQQIMIVTSVYLAELLIVADFTLCQTFFERVQKFRMLGKSVNLWARCSRNLYLTFLRVAPNLSVAWRTGAYVVSRQQYTYRYYYRARCAGRTVGRWAVAS